MSDTEYRVELCTGPLYNEEEVLRTHTADDKDDAVLLIEGLRDTYAARADVKWQATEVNTEGNLFGMAPGGKVYLIRVIPPVCGMSTDLRLDRIEARLDALEKSRPGRKGKPVLVSEAHICGVEPSIDSATCPYATLYRRNQGCQGDACVKKASEYYVARNAARKTARATV